MISVLCPSRGNPAWLARSAKSLRDTAEGEIEVLVAADDDDTLTIEMASAPAVADVLLVLPRVGYAGLHVYYQELALVAAGDWLMIWNDDDTMLTQGWDTVIKALPPEILVADIQSPHSPLSCTPAIRSRAVEVLGRFSTDNPHVDTFWHDLGLTLSVVRTVPVHIALESPVSTNSHDYYGPAHQAELAACIEVIRNAGLGEGH